MQEAESDSFDDANITLAKLASSSWSDSDSDVPLSAQLAKLGLHCNNNNNNKKKQSMFNRVGHVILNLHLRWASEFFLQNGGGVPRVS